MTGMITGGIDAISGIFGMAGGLRGAKAAASPGIAPLFYQYSGDDQQAAARAEAGSLSTQSSLAYQESLQDAAQMSRQVKATQENQALRMASSGITLQGSPLGILTETKILGQQQVDAIKARGLAVSGLLEQQGLQMLRQGSSAAFGGFAQSLQSKFEAANRSATLRSQAFQTGLSGLKAGIAALGDLGGGGGGGGSGGGYSPFGATSDPFADPLPISFTGTSGF